MLQYRLCQRPSASGLECFEGQSASAPSPGQAGVGGGGGGLKAREGAARRCTSLSPWWVSRTEGLACRDGVKKEKVQLLLLRPPIDN